MLQIIDSGIGGVIEKSARTWCSFAATKKNPLTERMDLRFSDVLFLRIVIMISRAYLTFMPKSNCIRFVQD